MANDFLPFAYDADADVMSQADYLAATFREDGFATGIAKSDELNKVWRQASLMAAAIGAVIDDRGRNAVEPAAGDLTNLMDALKEVFIAQYRVYAGTTSLGLADMGGLVQASAAAGVASFGLPASNAATGIVSVTIRKSETSVNAVNVVPNGTDRIVLDDGANTQTASYALTYAGDFVTLISGANGFWYIAATSTPKATTTRVGKSELATDAETITGTDATRTVTPQGLQAKLDDMFADSGWINCPLVNSFTQHGAVPLQYRKVGNIVTISGRVNRATNPDVQMNIVPAGGIPAGFQPSKAGTTVMASWGTVSPLAFGSSAVTIAAAGSISVGVPFPPAGSGGADNYELSIHFSYELG